MSDKDIQSILHEQRRFEPDPAFTAAARIGPDELQALQEKANVDHEGFWCDLAREEIEWHKPFTKGLDESNAPNYAWFADGELNVSYNCLDVHLAQRADKTAIIFEGEAGDIRRLSYSELHAEVCRFANGLKSLGVGRGDRVIIYMPMVPEAVISMQACARIGAVHSVVLADFQQALYAIVLKMRARPAW